MNANRTHTLADGGEPISIGIVNIISDAHSSRPDSLARGPESSSADIRRDRAAGSHRKSFTARWGRRIVAFAVGLATVATMEVMAAPSASAYVYTKGSAATVYIDNISQIVVTPPSPFTQYPHKTLRNISPPSVRVWRNGVASNFAQSSYVQHKLWRYNANGWMQTETRSWSAVIPAGSNTVSVTVPQFTLQMPSAFYFIETTVTLYNYYGVWLYTASIRPNKVSDFDCTAACVRYNDYVYIN